MQLIGCFFPPPRFAWSPSPASRGRKELTHRPPAGFPQPPRRSRHVEMRAGAARDGVGEAGTTAAIAAVMNAVADAIPGGAGAHLDMPASARRLWEACRRAQ